jgi:ribonuclease J
MDKQKNTILDDTQKEIPTPPDSVKVLSLGGSEDVTRNMYLYEYKDQILIVDCGLGFPDETMLGVDLLLPDITYLLNIVKTGKKKIVGMVLTHGHEDHIGGIPFILPQLPQFPVYASPLTAALTNAKLLDFHLPASIKTVQFTDKDIKLGYFSVSIVRVTHSVPDSANIIIKTPVGNLFHGSDFKFDFTPADGKRTEFLKITKAAEEGILCLMSDCLGSERSGFSLSEQMLGHNFEREMRECSGKFFITTYSSNIARVNQVIEAAERLNRRVCFVGRSVIKVKEIGQQLGYLKMRPGTEVEIKDVKKLKNSQVVLLVAGSQGQQNSALTRIAEGEHKDIRLDPSDVVVFSSDTIPGNELSVNGLVGSISKRGARVIQSTTSGGLFHVSGHGSTGDHMLLVALTKPKFLLPISGTYRHMVDYRTMAENMGYKRRDIFLIENGQEVIFTKESAKFGKKFHINNVFVDGVSGEEVEHFVVRDRERLGREGVVIIMAEINVSDGQLAAKPEIIARGSALTDTRELAESLMRDINKNLSTRKERVTNWIYVRKLIGQAAERLLFRTLKTRPLVLPVVIEV